MSNGDLFEPYERLVRLKILGKNLLVPENNLLLRCFQYLEPEEVPLGNFCWNAECRNCRVTLRRGGAAGREVLACQTVVEDGDEIAEVSKDVGWCFRKRM